MSERRPDLLETASEWLLRAEAGLEARDAERLNVWLAADPAHRAAYEAVLNTHEALERLGADESVLGLRRAALRARPARGRLPAAAIAACLIAAVTVGAAGWWGLAGSPNGLAGLSWSETRPTQYATAAGERAAVMLADGSTLELNTDSAAEVVFDHHERRIRLVKGQALFTVAHDDARPFQVEAGGRRVTALGTVFDVLLLSGDLRVAMLEGAVRVSSDAATGSGATPHTLSAGEVMTARAGGEITVRRIDTARLAGWREGVVYFDDTPLDQAAAEMSRYARAPITVADQRAGAQRVSGAFRTSEADTFADTMTDLFPVTVKRSADGSTVLSGAGL